MSTITFRRAFIAVFMLVALVAIPMRAAAQTTSLPFETTLNDPCTGGNLVLISGTNTTVISTKVTGSGDLHVDVTDLFKGTGVDSIDSTKTYTYSDSEKFSFNTPLPVGSGTLDSTFTQKLFLKGSKSLDNWTIKATIVIKVNANGIVTKDTFLTSDVCKG